MTMTEVIEMTTEVIKAEIEGTLKGGKKLKHKHTQEEVEQVKESVAEVEELMSEVVEGSASTANEVVT